MKILLIFYSRTGTTKKAAKSLSNFLKCDIEEILDIHSRKGIIGYLKSSIEAIFKKLPEIKQTIKNPALYDLIIIGTPIWALTMSSPIRTYISKNKSLFKKLAFFCTMGGSKGKTFKDMETLCEKTAITLLELRTEEVINENYIEKLKEFADQIKINTF